MTLLVSIPDSQFVEDYRKAVLVGRDIAKLKMVISLLEQQIRLPRSYRQHALNRAFQGFWSVHVEHDFLLIYKTTKTELLLARLGSHKELYGS